MYISIYLSTYETFMTTWFRHLYLKEFYQFYSRGNSFERLISNQDTTFKSLEKKSVSAFINLDLQKTYEMDKIKSSRRFLFSEQELFSWVLWWRLHKSLTIQVLWDGKQENTHQSSRLTAEDIFAFSLPRHKTKVSVCPAKHVSASSTRR